MSPLKLLLIAGARPNFMKVAPIIRAIQHHNERLAVSASPSNFELRTSDFATAAPPNSHLLTPICYKLVHTGQHYDEKMSEVFFRELGIPAPDINLGVGSGSHAVQTADIMARFEPVLLHAFENATSDLRSPISNLPSPTPSASALPDWLLVVGDVNSTMACTLVASKLGVKVAHVEAGLRSFDRTMPEEINRLVTDAIADLLLTPSADADENLRREGVPAHKIKLVGNVMIDSLVANLEKARASKVLNQLDLKKKGFVYVTLHRPANVDSGNSLRAIMHELKELSRRLPVVFPIHPRTRHRLAEFGLAVAPVAETTVWSPQRSTLDPRPSSLNPRPSTLDPRPSLLLIEPVGYHESLCLTENARLVLTDSGGLQEESTFFGTPCLTLRPNTERPVTISMGTNQLTALGRTRSDLDRVLSDESRVRRVPPLWEGRAAERVLESVIAASGME